MRNLKRALSLALAFVMVMSLMIVGTSAKSYTDADKIDNQVAVEILGELGVMIGNDDGSFAPDRDVTRAEMAVLITRILYGNNLNVDQFKDMNTFTDVPDWAEGFVNLCASLDIIAGRGNGIFDPDATVTTAEAALMLSRALGYFKNNAELGNDWALSAMKRATQVGIIGGDMVLQANAGLDRDDVAQMTFNTLTKAVPVQYNELLDVYYNVNQGVIYALEFNYLQTLGYTNFNLVYKSNQQAEYGRPATTWGIGSYKDAGNGTASGIEKADPTPAGGLIADNVRMLAKDEIITVNNTPVYVYSENTKEKDVYSDLGADVCSAYSWMNKDGYTWTAFVNGKEEKADIPGKNDTSKYTYTDKGSVTEIYVDDYAQTVTVVEINYYLGQVYSVNNGTTTIRTLSTDGKVLDDRTFATEEFAEDDYVVFTVDYNNDEEFYICEMMAPETVTGKVVRVENDKDSDDTYIRLDSKDGDKHYYTADGHMVYDVNNEKPNQHPTLNEEYILYMTPAGYVLGFELANEKVPQYLYVKDSDEHLSAWDAKVILPDATQPVVDLKDTFKKNGVNVDIAWDDESLQHANTFTNIDDLIWDYSVNGSDVYSLTYVPQLGIDADKNSTLYQNHVKGLEINNGKSYVEDRNDSTIFIVDEKTIFVDTMNDVAYTGYTEVPDVENAELAYVVEDGVAQIVFILDGDIYDANATYFFLTGLGRESEEYDDQDYYVYEDAYVDGQKQELTIAYNALREGIDHTLNTGVLYKVMKSFEADGTRYITEVQVVSGLYPDYMNVYEPQWVGSNAFSLKVDDNSNEVKYTTNSDTAYVLVEREAKNVKEYEYAYRNGIVYNDPDDFEWFVNPGRLSNMDEDLPAYVDTLVTVAKADRNNVAELVYIYQITPDINPEQYTVTVKDSAGTTIGYQRVEKGQTASIKYEAPAGYKVVLDNAAAKYEDGKVILPNVTANTTIKVTLEKILGEYTLTLKGNLSDAEVWNKAGTQKLNPDVTTVDGDKIFNLTENDEVIVKDDNINLGTYLYNGKPVTITTDDQMVVTMDDNTILNGAPSDRLLVIDLAEGVKAESDKWSKQDDNILYTQEDAKITVTGDAAKYIVTTSDTTLSWTGDVSAYTVANKGVYDMTKAGGGYNFYVKPVADVQLDSDVTAKLEDKTELTAGNYVVVIGTGLALDAKQYSVYNQAAGETNYGVAIETDTVKADAHYTAGWTVTLGKGVEAQIGTEWVKDTDIAVYGGKTVTLKNTEGTAIIEAPANNGVLVTGVTPVNSLTTISGDMTLVAATKVTIASGSTVVVEYAEQSANNQKFENGDAYVVTGTTLRATSQKPITVTNSEDLTAITGGYLFVAGDKEITVSAK